MIKRSLLISALFTASTFASFEKIKNIFRMRTEAATPVLEGSRFAENAELTQTPVIGIISQTLEEDMLGDPRFEGYNSYIMKSYVDSLEASGARIIPLIVGEPESVTMDKLSKINGVLYPGGDGDYKEFGRNLFWKIKEINDNGTYFPIWSTCMGYEYIVSYISDLGWDILDHYEYHSGGMALEFTVDPKQTKMYGWLGEDAFLLENYNLTYNSHTWGMNPYRFFNDTNLTQIFNLTAISYMPDGRPFVASIESERYPFFGTQFHPEKSSRVFDVEANVNHSWMAIKLNRQFTDYFVYQTRFSPQNHTSYNDVQQHIIQNYDSIVAAAWFDTVYVFK